MKQFILFIVILLFSSCEKLDLIPESPKAEERIELHIQLIKASAIISIDDSIYNISSNNEHSLKVFVQKSMKSFSIMKVSYGGKITAAVHDYTRGVRYDLGEIKDFISYKLD